MYSFVLIVIAEQGRERGQVERGRGRRSVEHVAGQFAFGPVQFDDLFLHRVPRHEAVDGDGTLLADTVGAVAGGLAGLYYGYEAVPEDWKTALKKRDYLEKLCLRADQVFPI